MTENTTSGRRRVAGTNTTPNSVQNVTVETPLSFDNGTTYHFSVKLYLYDTTEPDRARHRRGTWKEILPSPQPVSGATLNQFVAMVYGEADADSQEGMKACVDATIRRIGDDSWGKIWKEGRRVAPMTLEEELRHDWFDSIGGPKYNASLALTLRGDAIKAHNRAYKAVCTVIKETNGEAWLTYPYNKWLAAHTDSNPGGAVIGGNRFRVENSHPGRPE